MQALEIVKNLTDQHHPTLVEQVHAMKQQLEGMAAQQYVQACLMVKLIANVLQHARLYYSFRRPAELGKYRWIIDGKSASIGADRWETWWSNFVCPILESRSIKHPLGLIEGGRYEAEAKFSVEPSDWKKAALQVSCQDATLDLGRMVRDRIRFSPKPLFGLEAVDVMTNAIRRSLIGNLQRPGWIKIRNIMIHRSEHYIALTTLGPEINFAGARPYKHVLDDFTRGGRTMLPEHHQWS